MVGWLGGIWWLGSRVAGLLVRALAVQTESLVFPKGPSGCAFGALAGTSEVPLALSGSLVVSLGAPGDLWRTLGLAKSPLLFEQS